MKFIKIIILIIFIILYMLNIIGIISYDYFMIIILIGFLFSGGFYLVKYFKSKESKMLKLSGNFLLFSFIIGVPFISSKLFNNGYISLPAVKMFNSSYVLIIFIIIFIIINISKKNK